MSVASNAVRTARSRNRIFGQALSSPPPWRYAAHRTACAGRANRNQRCPPRQWRVGPRRATSIFLGLHQRQNTGRPSGVGRVFGAEGERSIEIVDLPEEPYAGVVEGAEIVLGVGVVIGCELRITSNRVEQLPDGHLTERCDAGRDDTPAANQRLAKRVVKVADDSGRAAASTRCITVVVIFGVHSLLVGRDEAHCEQQEAFAARLCAATHGRRLRRDRSMLAVW